MAINAVVIFAYRNSILSRASFIPGYAAKQDKDKKCLADKNSTISIATAHGCSHVLVLFAIEDGGRLGAYADVMIKAL